MQEILSQHRTPNYGIPTTIDNIAHASTIYGICERGTKPIFFFAPHFRIVPYIDLICHMIQPQQQQEEEQKENV